MATHEESIKAGTFSEKFKNTLRDYYSYGFKGQQYYEERPDARSKHTRSDDWARVNRILAGYFEWSPARGRKQAMFASADAQDLEENPFHRVYRFCSFNDRDPLYFFHMILALSPGVTLTAGIESLGVTEEEHPEEYWKLKKAVAEKAPLESAQLLCFFPDGRPLFPSRDQGSSNNRLLNDRLTELSELGFVEHAAKVAEGGGPRNHLWTLRGRTMAELLDCGGAGFEQRLFHALTFFSQTYVLGEVGKILRDRISLRGKNPFRFKHAYYAQALNDCSLIDFLYAVEHRLWCVLTCRHGISGTRSEFLCLPLELRVSTENGRTYVAVYEPFRRSVFSLRLEFVDQIRCVRSGDLEALDWWEKDLRAQDVARARRLLRSVWGVSTTYSLDQNSAGPTPLSHVRLRLCYDPAAEGFLPARLRRERRRGRVEPFQNGQVGFDIRVSDPVEMRPWVRSFYGHLAEVKGLDGPSFTVAVDVNRMAGRLTAPQAFQAPEGAEERSWEIPEAYRDDVRRISRPCTEHQRIFNEYFSSAFFVMAEVFHQLACLEKDSLITAQALDRAIEEALEVCAPLLGEKTREFLLSDVVSASPMSRRYKGIAGMLTTCGFLTAGYVRKTRRPNNLYEPDPATWREDPPAPAEEWLPVHRLKYTIGREKRFYRDILPLSLVEKRWLATVLRQPGMALFLSKEERAAVLDRLGEAVRPFPNRRIVYFDRFRVDAAARVRQAEMLGPLLEAVCGERPVELSYLPPTGKRKSGRYLPLLIRYSNRSDLFSVWVRSCEDGRLSIMRLSRLERVSPCPAAGDLTADFRAAADALEKQRRESLCQVKVDFYDTKNIIDKILTEFSPWKKRCTLDAQTGLYTLTIFYEREDERELVTRLLSYGADIRLHRGSSPKDDAVRREVVRRVARQAEIMERGI